jgi:N-acyl-D-aspartate/D-glutamate deacylase
MVADIVVFDPENVTDNGKYTVGENGLPSTGIPYVLVNGTVTVQDSKVVNSVFPGQPIRFAEESKGRFEPLEEKAYLDNLLAPVDFADEGLGSMSK